MSDTIHTPHIDIVRIRVLPDGRMDRANAAKYLGRKEKTLAMWKLQGKGPRCLRVMGRCFYFKEELDAFIRGDPRASSAQTDGGEQ